jgi:hypothetical protein
VPLPKGDKPGGSFADMVAAKGNKEIGDKVNKIIGRLADANDSLKGVIKVADFNGEEKLGKGKEMVDRLTKLVAIFEGLDFGSNRAEGDDLLVDAYEYLMRHFATGSGKSKGQFYTPAEVSRTMALVLDLGRAHHAGQSIYDPSVVLHAIRHIKPRLFGHGGVANPRDTYGCRCGLRLAISKNSSVLNVPSSMQHYTGLCGNRQAKTPMLGF